MYTSQSGKLAPPDVDIYLLNEVCKTLPKPFLARPATMTAKHSLRRYMPRADHISLSLYFK